MRETWSKTSTGTYLIQLEELPQCYQTDEPLDIKDTEEVVLNKELEFGRVKVTDFVRDRARKSAVVKVCDYMYLYASVHVGRFWTIV